MKKGGMETFLEKVYLSVENNSFRSRNNRTNGWIFWADNQKEIERERKRERDRNKHIQNQLSNATKFMFFVFDAAGHKYFFPLHSFGSILLNIYIF